MLRHLQKRQKLGNAGSDSDSDTSSDGGSAYASEDESQTGSDSDSDADSSHPAGPRIPASLLQALDHPIIDPCDRQDAGSTHSDSLDGSSSEASADPAPQPAPHAAPSCLFCPGKQLRTRELLAEHLRSKAHKRRLERYREFIQNPPPHTSLSPDPSEVIELIDALIGPPPVVPCGTGQPNKNQKRKKRKPAKTPQALEKKVLNHEQTAEKESDGPIIKSQSHQPPVKPKPTKRRRARIGKRERQEKLAKDLELKSS